jgi:peptide/nickel transport system ATP-binding protein/oligopeptide transport system ATP-binding protein
MDMSEEMLRLSDVKVHYPVRRGVFNRVKDYVKAVDGVSFSLGQRKSIGLVGESGCGKSTIGKAVIKLERVTEGSIVFEGEDIGRLSAAEMRRVWRRMQIVFQDPYSSLNPRKSIRGTLSEILTVHEIVPKNELECELERLIGLVGMDPSVLNRYPHEFSGGQRQRISIAKALAMKPVFMICDEAVSALDVSIQAQILTLLKELQSKLGLAYLFISHSLGAVKYISERVAVMYLGRLVELAETDLLFANPHHPYTQALLNAFPDPFAGRNRGMILQGNVPSPVNVPDGCAFHTRCPFAQDICRKKRPEMRGYADGGLAACHFNIHRDEWTGHNSAIPEPVSETAPDRYTI